MVSKPLKPKLFENELLWRKQKRMSTFSRACIENYQFLPEISSNKERTTFGESLSNNFDFGKENKLL